jgi:hypothetical protein
MSKKKVGTKKEKGRESGEEKGGKKRPGKKLDKCNKRKKPKINILTHELLASTLSYLMLAPW